jgi:hypothetical protein
VFSFFSQGAFSFVSAADGGCSFGLLLKLLLLLLLLTT